jgi:hypothetical protein
VTDQPVSPPFLPGVQDLGIDGAQPTGDAASGPARRLPGEPHPYMLQRNPPNLWILVWLTIFSLGLAALVLALTVVL